MKKNIAILGSTGSIGSTLLKVINKNNTHIVFLSAKKNYKKLLYQAKLYNVKNLIITDFKSFINAQKLNKDKNIKIFNSDNDFHKIIKIKLDYVMSSITGIEGLSPTFKIIKFTKKIAIANKESIICAWSIILKELKKYKTEFIPVDSEHFSIWNEIKDININKIRKVYLTASGGPLFKYKKQITDKINLKTILKHPTWKMGKKISVDSATMMNKFFEVIEAKNIFNLELKKIGIIIHPESYVHAIVEYNSGISKMILHDTTMEIPIANSIYDNCQISKKFKKIDIKKLNSLNFQKIDVKKYPVVNFLKNLPKKHSLFETVIVALNDNIVKGYLDNKIKFTDISKLFLKNVNLKHYKRYKNISPKKIDDIIKLNNLIKKDIIKNFS